VRLKSADRARGDAKMRRTEDARSAGRILPHDALWFGLGISLSVWVSGGHGQPSHQPVSSDHLAELPVRLHPDEAGDAINTVMGAIPGRSSHARRTAVRGHLSAEALVLFGVLFLWHSPTSCHRVDVPGRTTLVAAQDASLGRCRRTSPPGTASHSPSR